MMKITIEYSNKIYNFEHGYETYIFCAAVNNEFDKTHPDELKDFIFLVGECYLKDSNQTPLGALSDYMAENWDKIKHYKTMAHIHSLKGEMAEITVLEEVGNNDYIVDYKGVKCHALFNWFLCQFYADDVYRRVEE